MIIFFFFQKWNVWNYFVLNQFLSVYIPLHSLYSLIKESWALKKNEAKLYLHFVIQYF